MYVRHKVLFDTFSFKKKYEVLAPAGGTEQLIAAVRCGADAVYLGGGGFNARQGAENFGGRLREAVSYCHLRGVKVHVAVNTLVRDSELAGLDAVVRETADSGADAVIIQDLAVNAAFRDMCPGIERHASTQLTVHDLDGAKLAADLGFKRVVLARELTLGEIERITSRCGIETEVFIHGALCMCMSGACYLSSMLGGRSGNRGFCAQPCRLNFSNGERDHALSLKDMSHINHVRELRDAGVASFKIEGRLKRPEYVAAAVTAVRQALEGREYDAETLRAVFSRSGFTDGYLTGKRDVSMFGTRQREDAEASREVLGRLAGLYRAERRSVPVDMALRLTPECSELTVTCGGDAVTSVGPAPEPALTRELTPELAAKSLEKTGGTPYIVRDLTVDLDSARGMTLPAAAINNLRRDALDRLTDIRSRVAPHPVEGSVPTEFTPHTAPETPEIRAEFMKINQIPPNISVDRIIIPLEELRDHPDIIESYGDRLIVRLPALNFYGPGELERELRKAADMGVTDILTDNVYGIELGRRLGLRVHGGAGLNVMNTPAILELERLGLVDATVSFELSMDRIARLGGELPRGLVAYGRLPLMRFRACPIRKKNGCGGCPGKGTLRDRRGVEFPVICSGRRFGTLLNSVPLHIGGRERARADFLTLSFTLEGPEECARVIDQIRRDEPSDGPRTGGLYYRTLM